MPDTSLVAADPFAPPAEVAAMSARADAPRPEVNLLALAWRSRWLILFFMGVGAGVGWLLLLRAVPRYTSQSDIYVERHMPRLLDSDFSVGQSTTYLATQAQIIQSTSVIAAAVEQPEIAQLETIRTADNPVGLIREALSVLVGSSDEIIRIAIELPNREDAPRIVNAIVDSYISKYAQDRKNTALGMLSLLQTQKQRLSDELASRREKLDKFRTEHPELAVHVGTGNVVSDRFATLNSELNSTEIELLEAKALHTRVQRMYESPALRPLLADMAREKSQGVEEQSLLALQNQIQSVEMQIAAEESRWGKGHPRVKLLRDSLETWQARLDEQTKKLNEDRGTVIAAYVDSVKQSFELLTHKYAELQRSYDRQFAEAKKVSSLAIQLGSLESSVADCEKDNDALDEQIAKLNLTEDFDAKTVVSIMEVAGTPTKPSFPSRNRFLGVGAMLGSLVGFGLGWLRSLLDHRLKSADEITDATQLPVLGSLPLAPGVKDRMEAGRMLINAPRSALSESVRTLRTSFHFGLGGADAKVVCVTSPSPGDGKSTVASNFAIALAQSGQRVLLLDADMRKPRQHLIFDVKPTTGLASALAERTPVAEAILTTELPSLYLLPCGPIPANPVELLNNGYFGEVITNLSEHFDRIIIDSPPVLPVADARVIAAMSDATLLVLRAERATRRVAQAARNELWQVRAKRLGIVVNGIPPRAPNAYGGYGYGQYGGYGGYSDGGYGDVDRGDELPAARRKKSRARLTSDSVTSASDI